MPYSRVNTEYSIHQVQHHPKIDSLPLPASISSLGGWCTQLSTFPQLQVNKWIETQLPSRLPANRPPPSTPHISLDVRPASASPNSLGHTLGVHLWVHLISASKCMSKSLDHGLPVHLQTRSITASQCISKPNQSRPPTAYLSSLDFGHQVHLQNRLDHGLQAYC